MFKKLIKGVLTIICMASASSAYANHNHVEINTKNPYEMLESVAQQTFDRFNHDQDKIEKDLQHISVIVDEELLPYVDYKYASYKVLGQYLRETTKEQRDEFVVAFKDYLIATYSQAFTEYTDQKIKFGQETDFTNEKIVDVKVQVIDDNRPPINLLFKVRRLKDDTWKVYDMVAEGVSLLASKQSEITNLINQKGIDGVIEMLKEHTKITVESESKKDA